MTVVCPGDLKSIVTQLLQLSLRQTVQERDDGCEVVVAHCGRYDGCVEQDGIDVLVADLSVDSGEPAACDDVADPGFEC